MRSCGVAVFFAITLNLAAKINFLWDCGICRLLRENDYAQFLLAGLVDGLLGAGHALLLDIAVRYGCLVLGVVDDAELRYDDAGRAQTVV